MSIEWKYKIDLKDKKVFSEIEKERKIKIPEDLKKIIIEGNAATPNNYKVMMGSDERVVGAILSFNKDDKDVDTVFTALEVVTDKDLLPFGIDSFGNYFCYDLSKEKVVFWDHETGESYHSEYGIDEFLAALY
ncbi:SMI1/KNR4 family protein [Butyrivibrio sp. INlla16]|uniref:SMI1/KNR4 family protein n=1 Tax=Butyrivibrio sp. INlla16 TaxID=1520807 RepID=UPI00087E4D0E|nr:SMI1/KNR4 family protein [Butyrivibrio sp. INlla16]SDB13792.1 SMI1 / KNR4 family (SUKH-1) [Butyrivibrio sp. INlla16]